MIPRGAPDIGWRDLLFGLSRTLIGGDSERAGREADTAWTSEGDMLACLSVRSGFDLVLQVLALPPGSEVLVSAVTIPHMLELIEQHGLLARPLDLDPHTLAVDGRALARAISERTRALLVAHLWGSRMPMDELSRLAQQHGLVLIEDCAQAFDADYRGHPGSDISMWSFGPIKSATALGGALLRFRDRGLLERVRSVQATYPPQSRRSYANRIARVAVLKLLASPLVFGGFVALCRARGIDHDELIFAALRSFGRAGLLARLRQRPCNALLKLLARRLQTADPRTFQQRAKRARRVLQGLPSVERPGDAAMAHSYWMIPILSRQPDALVRHLWSKGFDATRRGSSLKVAAPSAAAPCAAELLERLVYLPVYPRLSLRDTQRLCRAVQAFETNRE